MQGGTYAALRRHGLELVKIGSAGRWDFTKAKPSFKLQQYNSITKVLTINAVDTGGGLFAFQNPHSSAIFVSRVILNVTTEATSGCTADIGVAADATTLSDTLMDAVNVGAAVINADNIQNSGSSGHAVGRKVDAKGGSNDYITGSVASGASSGIVGQVTIEYTVLEED